MPSIPAETTDASIKTRDEREAEWWAAWREANYSWKGLAEKPWLGWSVVIATGEIVEGDPVEPGTRAATLQDYWRDEGPFLTDPKGNGWTRVHCPLKWSDGTPTPKASWNEAERAALEALLSTKLSQATETKFDGPWDDRELFGADRRAQLQGAVLFGAPVRREGAQHPWSVRFDRAYFAQRADFTRATFSGDTQFTRAMFLGGAHFNKADFKGDVRFDFANFLSPPTLLTSFLQVLGDTSDKNAIQRVNRLLDELGVLGSEREEVEQNLMEAIAADLLVRLGEQLSEADKKQLAEMGDETGQEPDLTAIARFFRERFSEEQLVRLLGKAAKSVLAEFEDAMTRIDSAANSDGASDHSAARATARMASKASANIASPVRFDNATFAAAARFERAIFYETSLSNAKFQGLANFNESQFVEDALFYRAVFQENAWFETSIFLGEAVFERARFADVASFCGAEFGTGVNFCFAQFGRRARFERTEFSKNAAKGRIEFGFARFAELADFNEAIFPDRCEQFSAAFRGAQFDGVANFGEAGVHWIAAFHGALIKENLILDDPKEAEVNAEFRKILRGTRKTVTADLAERIEMETKERSNKAAREGRTPKAITRAEKDAWAKEAPQKRLKELAGGCRVIKNAMARQSDELMSQRYYRFQLMARRRQHGAPRWEKIFSFLYGAASDYGASMSRPLGALMMLLAASTAFYWAWGASMSGEIVDLLSFSTQRSIDDSVWEAASFSASRIAPFGPWATDTPAWLVEMDKHGAGIGLLARVIGAVETLVAIVLAFLFALAVRRRFQIA